MGVVTNVKQFFLSALKIVDTHTHRMNLSFLIKKNVLAYADREFVWDTNLCLRAHTHYVHLGS